MLNSSTGCFFSNSGDVAAELPTFPNALSISKPKLPSALCFFFASGGVGRGGLRASVSSGALPLGLLIVALDDSAVARLKPPSDKSNAGGRDFISFARAREMVGTVQEEITGASNEL